MTDTPDPLVPGCPRPHPRWVHVVVAAVGVALLVLALVWLSRWSAGALAVWAYAAAFHPFCRAVNRRDHRWSPH